MNMVLEKDISGTVDLHGRMVCMVFEHPKE
jgi:hypothetical protein